MKIILRIFLLVLLFNNNIGFANWDKQIQDYSFLLSNAEGELIKKQYNNFSKGEVLSISDPIIKKIPIVESEEALIDIRKFSNPRIKMLPSPKFAFESGDYNSGFKECSRVREGLYNRLLKLVEKLDKIAPNFGYNKKQFNILIFEGLRSLKTQDTLYKKKLAEVTNNNPQLSKEQCEKEAAIWLSPVENNVPSHSTGGAIDIRIFDTVNNKFLDMGEFGVIWSPNPSAPTFSTSISEEQIKNRLFLLIASTNAGLINYPFEFWHFSYGDRYAAFWLNKNNAVYGSIKE